MLRNRAMRERLYCTAEYWNAKAAELDGDAVSMWSNNNLNVLYHLEQLDVIGAFLPDVRGLSILDVGCGTGRISRYLADRGAVVAGFDFSDRAIEIARGKTGTLNPSYRVQSIFELDDVAQYDVVVSWGSVTIACRTEAQLQDAGRRLLHSLKPGGTLLLLEPIHKGFLHRVLDMDVKTFCHNLERAGFQVQDVRHLHFWPMRLALAYMSWPKFITAPFYRIGQCLMRRRCFSRMGDYQAVYAKTPLPEGIRPSSHPAMT